MGTNWQMVAHIQRKGRNRVSSGRICRHILFYGLFHEMNHPPPLPGRRYFFALVSHSNDAKA